MDSQSTGQSQARLSDVVACLSLTSDLATGQALEHGLRRALLALWIGQELGINESSLSDVYYVGLLGSVGCALEAAEFSSYFNDEIAFGEQLADVDPTRPLQIAGYFLGKAGEGERPLGRARKILSVAVQGPRRSALVCRDVAMQVGDMLEMGPVVREAVGQCHEQWNGRGWPRGLRGEGISEPARLYILAHDVEIASRRHGLDAAQAMTRRRAGSQYDPRFAGVFVSRAGQLLRRLDSVPAWDAFLEAEPAPHRVLHAADVRRFAEAIANFVDSRSSFTLGHSPSVASIAEKTARELGLSDVEASSVRDAGLLHDVGRAAIPVTLWEKRGPLLDAEWERMKKHPSYTELLLARSGAFGHLGTLAALHHERIDGSGYHGMAGASQPLMARILATADAYQTKVEDRPHRAAMTSDRATAELQAQARDGRLDLEVANALMAAVGQTNGVVRTLRPAGLSDREVEVLRLAAKGMSNREMANLLYLSPKTVGHHIQHIYDKIGVSTRVGATLFALRHGLLDNGTPSGFSTK